MKVVRFSDVTICKHPVKVTVYCQRYTKNCLWGQFIRSYMGTASMLETVEPVSVTVWDAGVYWPADKIFSDAQEQCKKCVALTDKLKQRINQRVKG